MSTESYLLEKKEKSWMGRLLKLLFILSAFFLVIATVLFNMGGSDDTLKEHVESYLSRTLGGRPATVGKLGNMSFFPRVGLDIQDTVITGHAKGSYPVLEIGRLQAYMNFWNVATRAPRFTQLYIEDLKALKGLFIPREFTVEKLYIDHDIDTGKAVLRANGKLDIHPWSVEAGLEVFGSKKGKYQYSLSGNIPLVVDIADIHLETMIVNHEREYFKIENAVISSEDVTVKGNVVLSVLAPRMLKAKADFDFETENSGIEAEIIFDLTKADHKYSGTISSEELDINDISGEQQVMSLLKRLYEVLGYAGVSESGDVIKDLLLRGGKSLDLNFDIKKLKLSEQEANALRFTVQKDGGLVKLGPFVNDKVRFPALFMMKDDAEKGAFDILVQDGTLDTAFASRWIPALSSVFSEGQNVNITCGIGHFTIGHDSLVFDDLDVQTSLGDITVAQKTIKDGTFEEITLKKVAAQNNPGVLSLDKKAYDFVQSSLQRSAKTSPCAQYIQLEEKE